MAYTEEIKEAKFSEIINEVAKGEPLRIILSRKDMPDRNTFYKWLNEEPEKVERYARAKELYQDEIFEEMKIIADTPAKDIRVIERPNGKEIITGDSTEHRKLQIETRKWILGKLNPKKYGEKLDLTSDGKNINSKPLENMTTEELIKRATLIKELENSKNEVEC